MGMVPIPEITPLTISRSEEPSLEPALPISRIHEQSSNSGEQADEGYSPSQQQPPPEEIQSEPGSSAADPISDHELNLFA